MFVFDPLHNANNPYFYMILFKVLIDYPSTFSTDCMLDMCLTYDKILILSSGANKVLEIHIDAEYIKNY